LFAETIIDHPQKTTTTPQEPVFVHTLWTIYGKPNQRCYL